MQDVLDKHKRGSKRDDCSIFNGSNNSYIVGIIFGPATVLALLAGALCSGFILAIMMANSGGAWDNAKKFIEKGHFGGKKSVSS
jgi:Na+/H+-translocating membrane pyrophosphatase